MNFKAAILTEIGKPLTIGSLRVPPLSTGQVLVRVKASGICGAQIGEISGAKGPDPWLPHLMGHEGGGVVEEVGPGVTRVRRGDSVVMHWRKAPGIEASPPKYIWEGHKPLVGGGWVTTFNEMAVVSENRLTPVGRNVPFEVAALMGCAVTTALGLVDNEAMVRIGESVVVAGCGGVGLNVIQGARLVGAYPVIGYDRSASALGRAQAMGADLILSPEDDIEVEVRKACGKSGADVFVDCTGSPEVIAQGLDLIRPGGGRVILVGQPHGGQDLLLPGFRKHYCGKVMLDSQGGLTDPASDIPRYIRLFNAGRLPLMSLITHRFPLERINEALDVVRSGEAGRVILEMP